MTCDRCHRPEPQEHLAITYTGDGVTAPTLTCRRCRLAPAHRPLWDDLQAAEAAVIADVESSEKFGRLLAARVAFDTAVRPARGKAGKARR